MPILWSAILGINTSRSYYWDLVFCRKNIEGSSSDKKSKLFFVNLGNLKWWEFRSWTRKENLRNFRPNLIIASWMYLDRKWNHQISRCKIAFSAEKSTKSYWTKEIENGVFQYAEGHLGKDFRINRRSFY